ncbi:hypothetical protein CONLIGDRAFT_586111, partial [Coniochaeta ligniaria NRRL 30616]
KRSKTAKTYNIRDSPVVTHPSTSLTITGLSMGERTGSRVFQYLWSYVKGGLSKKAITFSARLPGHSVLSFLLSHSVRGTLGFNVHHECISATAVRSFPNLQDILMQRCCTYPLSLVHFESFCGCNLSHGHEVGS